MRTSDAVSVRRATRADLPALTAHEPPGAGIADNFLQHQDDGRILFAVAFEDGIPLGSGVLDWANPPRPELKHLYVYKEHRNRGAAGRLCLWLEEQARAAGASSLYLGVSVENAVAQRLYSRLGYMATGETEVTTYTYLDDAGVERSATEHDVVLSKDLQTR